MTEQEWLACTEPAAMLRFLRRKASDRKLRLFSCACCVIFWHLLNDKRNRRAIELAERLAEGATERSDVVAVRAATKDVTAWCTLLDSAWEAAWGAAGSGARDAARSAFQNKTWEGREARETVWWQARAVAKRVHANLLRCILGNPFRPITITPSWLSWHGGLLVSMARQMYDSRDFSDMPVLADALEEAGCQDQHILGHCRSGGEHVRGCWVADLLLGKE